MAWAACRPSAMAQTIRLWPRVMSPAVKTLATLVCLAASALTLPSRVELDAELFEHPACARGRRSPSPAGRGRPG